MWIPKSIYKEDDKQQDQAFGADLAYLFIKSFFSYAAFHLKGLQFSFL